MFKLIHQDCGKCLSENVIGIFCYGSLYNEDFKRFLTYKYGLSGISSGWISTAEIHKMYQDWLDEWNNFVLPTYFRNTKDTKSKEDR